MSSAAKRAGYVVTMVPAQSYFDVSAATFNRTLLHAYPDWHPEVTAARKVERGKKRGKKGGRRSGRDGATPPGAC